MTVGILMLHCGLGIRNTNTFYTFRCPQSLEMIRLHLYKKCKFVKIKKFRHSKFPNFLPPFFQFHVFCTLCICICSGVTKGYRGEDKALEMDWKVWGGGGGGGNVWCAQEGGSLKN